MRVPAPRFLLLLVMALFVAGASARVAHADQRSDAKVHYQAGVKAYSSQDYRTAIKEFSAAQAIMPADLNNYNLALCYDKLGEAEPAIQYYKEYLAKVPNTDKRVEIEASVSRLEAALQSAAAKRAEEQRKADEAAKADAARKADEARKAEEARRAEEAKRQPPIGDAANPDTQTATGVGSTGVPSTGQTVSTGDAQLDRVAGIDVNSIRDQRVGGAGSGMPDNRVGPGGPNGNAGVGAAGGSGGAGMQANAGGAPSGPVGMGPDDKPIKKETPVYKKWWFWAVVAVSAYVVYSIAVDGSSSNTRAREVLPPSSPGADPTSGAAPLFRF
ncbi:MAG TPA: tetratricopeptide repeat protein [Kofleriaceae bacterium]|nr:tetratricopeptide repeat protein [Kofleriaceae bacterium]